MAAGIGVMSASNGVAACSGARVTFEEINAEATRIVVGTIRAIRWDQEAPDGMAITVEAVVRGAAAPEIFPLPPTYMGCDGRNPEPVGARLLIATGPHYFDASPPKDLHPYWLIGPADIVEPAGVEDPDVRHRTLGDLVDALDGDLVPVPTPDSVETFDQSPGVGDEPPIALVVLALVATAASVLGVVALVARRRAPGA